MASVCGASDIQQTQRSKLVVFLELHGLAMRCRGMGAQVQAELLVKDAITASAVLRGPLADGEVVEIGGRTAQVQAFVGDSEEMWAPDVHFNRHWLDSAMAEHHLLQAGNDGGRRLGAAKHRVRMASR